MKTIALLLLLCSTSFAQTNWIYVGSGEKGALYFVEKPPRQPDQAIVAVWSKMESRDGTSMLILQDFNCAHRMVQIRQYVHYDKNGALVRKADSLPKWDTVLPETMGEVKLKVACGIPVNLPSQPTGNSIAEILARTPPSSMEWKEGDPQSNQVFIDGVRIKILARHDDLAIGVGVLERGLDVNGKLRKTVVALFAINDTGQLLDIDPSSLTLTRFDQPKGSEPLKRETVEQISKSLNRRAVLLSFLGGAAAGMAQQTSVGKVKGTVYTSEGSATVTGTVVTTSPNREAQQRAARQSDALYANARATSIEIQDAEARAQTLTNGEVYRGLMFFERVKKCDAAEVRLKVAGTEFRFPVSW